MRVTLEQVSSDQSSLTMLFPILYPILYTIVYTIVLAIPLTITDPILFATFVAWDALRMHYRSTIKGTMIEPWSISSRSVA
jgi:hypothetical protein